MVEVGLATAEITGVLVSDQIMEGDHHPAHLAAQRHQGGEWRVGMGQMENIPALLRVGIEIRGQQPAAPGALLLPLLLQRRVRHQHGEGEGTTAAGRFKAVDLSQHITHHSGEGLPQHRAFHEQVQGAGRAGAEQGCGLIETLEPVLHQGPITRMDGQHAPVMAVLEAAARVPEAAPSFMVHVHVRGDPALQAVGPQALAEIVFLLVARREAGIEAGGDPAGEGGEQQAEPHAGGSQGVRLAAAGGGPGLQAREIRAAEGVLAIERIGNGAEAGVVAQGGKGPQAGIAGGTGAEAAGPAGGHLGVGIEQDHRPLHQLQLPVHAGQVAEVAGVADQLNAWIAGSGGRQQRQDAGIAAGVIHQSQLVNGGIEPMAWREQALEAGLHNVVSVVDRQDDAGLMRLWAGAVDDRRGREDQIIRRRCCIQRWWRASDRDQPG